MAQDVASYFSVPTPSGASAVKISPQVFAAELLQIVDVGMNGSLPDDPD